MGQSSAGLWAARVPEKSWENGCAWEDHPFKLDSPSEMLVPNFGREGSKNM